MKKLMTLMLGLSILGGTFALVAQEAPKDTKNTGGKKKSGKKKKDETTKKEGSGSR